MGLARQEAQHFSHDYIGTEHILLGLVEEQISVAVSVLKNLDVDLKKIRHEVEQLVSEGTTQFPMGQLPFTPRARKVLELSLEEASNLGHTYIGTEHLLLGLIRENDGIAWQVLTNMKVDLHEVREEILELLGSDPTDPDPDDEYEEPEYVGLPKYERYQAMSVFPGSGVEIERRTALILMPESEAQETLWTESLQPAMDENKLQALVSGQQMRPIWGWLRTAEVIVADVTGLDPTVMFQLGLCFGLHRCPILLTQEVVELPMHLRNLRHIQYDDTSYGRATLRVNLTHAIEAFLEQVRD